MVEGDVVMVVGKLDERIEVKELRIGTFIGYVTEKQVQVLLPDGTIFLGHIYDIVPHKE